MEAYAELMRWWGSSSDSGPRPAGSEAAVRTLESRFGLRLPDDFRLFLLHAAPTEDYWDDEDVIWWSPGRIRNIPQEYEHPINNAEIASEADRYLFFADYMIWCWAWAICCGDGKNRGRIAFIGDDPDRFVADSFTDFVTRYLGRPDSVW